MFTPRIAALLVAIVGLITTPGAQTAEDPRLAYFRDLAETRNYTLGEPVTPKFTPDGRAVIFLRSEPRSPVLRLYEFDLAAGRERELITPERILRGAEETLSPEEKARRERSRQSLRGFTAFQLSKDGTRLLVTLSGRLFLVNRADLHVTELPGTGWIDPRLSPDGQFVAAVEGGELNVIDLASGAIKPLTTGATATLTHGTAEFVAQEEMSRHEGYWWSPDSTTLLYQETDESAVEVRYLADPLHPEVPPAKFFYPRAGTANARVRLGLVPREGGATRWITWDAERYPYVARVRWKNAKAPPTLLVQNRAQQKQALLAVDIATGETRELLVENDAAWLDLDDHAETPLWMDNGETFLWTTERGGTWQVEHRTFDGGLIATLTPPAFGYQGLLDVDEAAGALYVKGGTDPRERQLWWFPLTSGEGKPLTREPGLHDAVFTEDKHTYAHKFELADGRSGWELVRTLDSQVLATLPSVAERPAAWPQVELTRTDSDPAFDAALIRPRAFVAGRRYPVLLNVYAGPTSKRVTATARGYLTDQWLADQGYIVVRIDNRGTPWQGRDWGRAVRGNLIDHALNDQIAGLQSLARRHPEMDLGRVGVTGWSFGGYFTAMATIRRPDIFKAGVAGAPVVTWENYDTHYTERYLGLPAENPEAYRVSNVTTYAAKLERPLLLLHGLTDDNVYFQHTLQLADALYLAGKPFELLPMLGTHMVNDPVVKLRQQARIADFFNQVLKP